MIKLIIQLVIAYALIRMILAVAIKSPLFVMVVAVVLFFTYNAIKK